MLNHHAILPADLSVYMCTGWRCAVEDRRLDKACGRGQSVDTLHRGVHRSVTEP